MKSIPTPLMIKDGDMVSSIYHYYLLGLSTDEIVDAMISKHDFNPNGFDINETIDQLNAINGF